MTSYALTEFDTTVEIMIKASDSDDDLDQDDRYDRIKDALQQYSHDMPQEFTEDVTGDGGKYYGLTASLTSWSEDWSQVLRVEYPAATITSDEAPTVLENDTWEVYEGGDDLQYIYFKNATPASTEAFRIRYTVPYIFAGSPLAVDIPREHFYAICKRAACLCCRAISAKYSRLNDSPLGVDSGAHSPKANEFSLRGNEYCSAYYNDLGLPDPAKDPDTPPVCAAAEFANIDTRPGYPRWRRYVFHRDR